MITHAKGKRRSLPTLAIVAGGAVFISFLAIMGLFPSQRSGSEASITLPSLGSQNRYEVENSIAAICGNKYVAHCIVTESISYGLNPYKMATISFSESAYDPKAHYPHWSYWMTTNIVSKEKRITRTTIIRSNTIVTVNTNRYIVTNYTQMSNLDYDRGLFQVYYKTAIEMLQRYGDDETAREIAKNRQALYDVHINAYVACLYMRWILDTQPVNDEIKAYMHYFGGRSGERDISRATDHYDKFYTDLSSHYRGGGTPRIRWHSFTGLISY